MIRMTRGIIQPGGQSRFRLAASCAEAEGGQFAYFISSSVGRDSETTLQNAYINKKKTLLFFLRFGRPCIVVLIPTWYKVLYKLHKIKFLYMFRSLSAHLQEVNDVNCTCLQPLVFSFSASGGLVHLLRGDSPLSKCTRRPPAENENTRGCIHVQLTSLTSWRWADDARNM